MIQEMGVVEMTRARVARDIRSSVAWPAWFGTLSDIWWTRVGGGNAIAEVRALRTAKLMEHARAHAASYRHSWRNLPLGPPALGELPVVTKRALMARFDEWVTDPAIKRQDADSFLRDRDNILFGKAPAAPVNRAFMCQDEIALGTYDALVAMQATAAGMTGAEPERAGAIFDAPQARHACSARSFVRMSVALETTENRWHESHS